MDDLVWETPDAPRKSSSKTDNKEIAARLRSRPGEWALVEHAPRSEQTRVTSLGQHIRKGRAKAFQPAGSFEATQRLSPEDVKLYARYVGEQP